MSALQDDPPTRPVRVAQSLPLRVTLFLTLALLPLGVLAIWQTSALWDTARSRADLSLIALTELATSGETDALVRALGVSEALAGTVLAQMSDPAQCSETLSRFVADAGIYSFAGLIAPDLQITCSSAGRAIGLTSRDISAQMMANPQLAVVANDGHAVSGEPVVAVLWPVWSEARAFEGYFALSVPLRKLSAEANRPGAERPLDLAIYNGSGQLLAQTIGAQPAPAAQPHSLHKAMVLHPADAKGLQTVIQPMIPGLVYAVATWPRPADETEILGRSVPPALLPVLMWAASLLVAYFAIHRLVVRHIHRIGRQMRRFAEQRYLPPPSRDRSIPHEIVELEENFHAMTLKLIADEAKMEDTLRDKSILMREIHHRVKNNLQLISSIMNMQIRTETTPQTRDSLRRLQDRVIGLSIVYRYLYQTPDLSHTSAARLLTDICNQALNNNGTLQPRLINRIDIADTPLIPDQAVPLALLTGEIVSNAMKHVGRDSDQPAQLVVTFSRIGDLGTLTCRNTHAPDTAPISASLGLGQRLIVALASQLDATPQIAQDDGWYTIVVSFKLQSALIPDRTY